jgi:hypothetical protein
MVYKEEEKRGKKRALLFYLGCDLIHLIGVTKYLTREPA